MSFVLFGTVSQCCDATSILDGIIYELNSMMSVSDYHPTCDGQFFHSRSRSFPGIIASDSRSRILGMLFFIPFPFPNFGNAFFHSLPVPEFWEWIFSFPSRSRILGMEFSIPFPFPNFGNGIFYSRSRSRTLKSHSCSPLIASLR